MLGAGVNATKKLFLPPPPPPTLTLSCRHGKVAGEPVSRGALVRPLAPYHIPRGGLFLVFYRDSTERCITLPKATQPLSSVGG